MGKCSIQRCWLRAWAWKAKVLELQVRGTERSDREKVLWGQSHHYEIIFTYLLHTGIVYKVGHFMEITQWLCGSEAKYERWRGHEKRNAPPLFIFCGQYRSGRVANCAGRVFRHVPQRNNIFFYSNNFRSHHFISYTREDIRVHRMIFIHFTFILTIFSIEIWLVYSRRMRTDRQTPDTLRILSIKRWEGVCSSTAPSHVCLSLRKTHKVITFASLNTAPI